MYKAVAVLFGLLVSTGFAATPNTSSTPTSQSPDLLQGSASSDGARFSVRRRDVPVVRMLAMAQTGVNSADDGARGRCSAILLLKSAERHAHACDIDSLRRLANEGRLYEQNQVGIASIMAIGGFQPGSAFQWFKKAAERGYGPAQVNLAILYANGWTTQQNYGAALYWLRQAVDQKYVPAYYNLGLLYMNGAGVRKDPAEAVKYFRLGAEGGDTWAQTNLGYMYDEGLGVSQNYQEAAFWYRKAADAGQALAQNNLADMYLRGNGVTQDDKLAFHWFQLAAEQGLPAAWIKLGYMMSAGRGCPTNPEAAYSLVLAAANAGDTRGHELLASLKQKLTGDELARAQTRSAEFQRIDMLKASLQE